MKKYKIKTANIRSGGGSFYNLLNKDIKELNITKLFISCIIFLMLIGFISYKITNSYALFTDNIIGSKTIEVEVSFNYNSVFNYTGDVQKYVVPRSGNYFVELAGASGGSTSSSKGVSQGGNGAKTSGYIYLNKNEELYFYVGSSGKSSSGSGYVDGGYNGGGRGHGAGDSYPGASGGGATDVRLVGGAWDNTSSLVSRIMVASGGGGASYKSVVYSDGAAGGGLIGTKPRYTKVSLYGMQLSGGVSDTSMTNSGTSGSFGHGGDGSSDASGGGGGGYYGGAGASQSSGKNPGGSGGSSYISGYAGVNSVKDSSTITHTNDTLHYSGKYFINGKMVDDKNSGNGYAKISYVGSKPKKINDKLNSVRYIKNCSNIDSAGALLNYFVEVQAIKDGINVAKGKTISAPTSVKDGYSSFSILTDGIISVSDYTVSASSYDNYCVTVDLEKEYDLDEISIWHTYGTERSYNNSDLSVSNDGTNYTKLIYNKTSSERGQGLRYSAYSDIYTGYSSNGLMLWYDGYNNIGNSNYDDNFSSTLWKDLSKNGKNGTLKNGPTWYGNYLSFDGSDDWVSIAQMNYDYATQEVVTLKSAVTGNNEYILGNQQNSGNGIIYSSSKNIMTDYYIGTGFNNISTSYDLNKINSNSVAYDGNALKLYSFGTLKNSLNISGKIIAPTGNTLMALGVNPYGSSYDANSFYKGNIYSVRIYNRALTENEIVHNYLYDKDRFNLE